MHSHGPGARPEQIRQPSPMLTRQRQLNCCLFSWLLNTLTHYGTPKIVRFEAKWIGGLSLFVKLSLAVGCSYLMCQRSSYQIFDRSPISAVTIDVTHDRSCSNETTHPFISAKCIKTPLDVNDFIIPATENAAVTIATRMVKIKHVLRECGNETLDERGAPLPSHRHRCDHRARCILPPFHRQRKLFARHQLCWFQLPSPQAQINYEALDYIIFIKHFVEFTQLSLTRHNLQSKRLRPEYASSCEFDPVAHPLCPRFRVLKILQMLESDPDAYEQMFYHGSLIEIRISWKCNLDLPMKYCEPIYAFKRLDVTPYDSNPYEPGSNFLISRHFFRPNDHELHRLHTRIYNLHIIFSVTGEAGEFDLFQTTTSIGSFLGVFGTGAIVCDLMATFISNFNRVRYEN